MTSATHSSSLTSISYKVTPRKASKSSGRSWKDLTKSVAKAAGYAALASLAMLSVAALIVGIIAMVNPAGLAMIGSGITGIITGGIALVIEKPIIIVGVGLGGLVIGGIACGIVFVVKKCTPPNISVTTTGSIASVS